MPSECVCDELCGTQHPGRASRTHLVAQQPSPSPLPLIYRLSSELELTHGYLHDPYLLTSVKLPLIGAPNHCGKGRFALGSPLMTARSGSLKMGPLLDVFCEHSYLQSKHFVNFLASIDHVQSSSLASFYSILLENFLHSSLMARSSALYIVLSGP